MICARCAREVAAGAQRCPNCSGDPLLDGRYRLERQLGEDSVGVSYRATRIEDATLVRARSCMLRRLPGEPERAARSRISRELDHPGLPGWIDEFVIGDDPLATLWSIHEHLGGRSLTEALAEAPERRFDGPRTIRLLRELAELLAYLHGRHPPVVHGALTPSRIQLRSGDGRACVLDLGHASAAVHGAGNRGLAEQLAYAAPEQLHADPIPASDVWTLGAIALVSCSGASLASLRDAQRSLRWRERVTISPDLADVLARMLEPDPAGRISAAELVDMLASLEPASERPNRRAERHHPPPSSPPKPVPPRASTRVAGNKSDVPVMRPDELSRELSQAHHALSSLAQQQRTHLVLARVLVVIVAAVIAGLATYVVWSLN